MGTYLPPRKAANDAGPSRRRNAQNWEDEASGIIALLEAKKPLSSQQKKFCSCNLRRLREHPENLSETQHILLARIKSLTDNAPMNARIRNERFPMPMVGASPPNIFAPEYANLLSSLDGFLEMAKILGGGSAARGQSYIKRDSGIYEVRGLAEWRDKVRADANQGKLPPEIKEHFSSKGFDFGN